MPAPNLDPVYKHVLPKLRLTALAQVCPDEHELPAAIASRRLFQVEEKKHEAPASRPPPHRCQMEERGQST